MKHFTSRAFLFLLSFLLIAASALTLFSCKEKDPSLPPEEESPVTHTFTLEVVAEDGTKTTTEISTQKSTVGEALLEKGIVEGEDTQHGLYIKKVNGILADYEVTGTYWAFYVNGEYALNGAEKTEIQDGYTYTLKVEK